MAPTKTRPLLWLLPALAAAQSCHKSRKGVRCNNRTGRDRRCWADEKCGRGAAEPVVPTFAALDRCRRPRCAACGSGAAPVLYGEFHADHRGRTTVQVEVHAPLLDVGGLRRLSAARRLGPHRRGGPGRPGKASRPDDGRRAPAHGPLVDRRRISRGTQLVLQHTGAAQSELCHGSDVHLRNRNVVDGNVHINGTGHEFRAPRMRRPSSPSPGGRAIACVTTPTNYPSSPRAAARTTSASASASTTTLPL